MRKTEEIRPGLEEGEKPCRSCHVVKPCTFNTATSGFYMYRHPQSRLWQGWDGICCSCKNLERADAKAASVGRPPKRRDVGMTIEQQRARRRERHDERMRTDPDYRRARNEKHRDYRARHSGRVRLDAKPMSELLQRVLSVRYDGSLKDMCEALELDERWVSGIRRGKPKTIPLKEIDSLLVRLDVGRRIEDLYPELT